MATSVANLLFGTSGWSYKEWVGPVYPANARMFSFYSQIFHTAEINSTFYAYPKQSIIYGLNRVSPSPFLFSAKLPRIITHTKRLDLQQKVENYLFRFLDLLQPLNASGKLGCLLIQLPPSFQYPRDQKNLASFLEILPQDYDFAVEFRNLSWIRDDLWRLLTKYEVAYCIVDEPLLPPEVHLTADFAYFRWHGHGSRLWYDYHYSQSELQAWLPRIEDTSDHVNKIYGYFNNHFHGYAVENCIEILEMLDAATPQQTSIKTKIKDYTAMKSSHVPPLAEFSADQNADDIRPLFLQLSDRGRVTRGLKLSEPMFTQKSSTHVTGMLRNYRFDIDVGRKTIRHNCDDWRKGIPQKRLCKHVIKLFSSLPTQQTEAILLDIIQNKSTWQFLAE
jgi:uncharacterized protein YecE (DUF72 family)